MKGNKSIYGLVMCGGQSSRMGKDKSLLTYHGMPQRNYLYNMLEGICQKTFISCNPQQAKNIPSGYSYIIDSEKYQEIGPMGGLLTALERFPDQPFLVVGCDYPFITKDDLEMLVNASDNNGIAVSYVNEGKGIREPLLAIYQPECYDIMLDYFQLKNYSLNHFLKTVHAGTIIPQKPVSIQNINTPEAYEKALKKIGSAS